MGRFTICPKTGLKRGTWSVEEDRLLSDYITRYGHCNWRELPKYAGLSRCGKSCRLRWMNYLRPNIKRGNFSWHEEQLIINLHEKLGNRWSAIAACLPGRTDNEIKNHWHTHLKKHTKENGKGANQEVLKCTSLAELILPNSVPFNNVAPPVFGSSGALPIYVTPTEAEFKEHQESQGSELSMWWDGSIEFTDMENSHCHQPPPPNSSSFPSSIYDSSENTNNNDDSEISILDYDGDLWGEPFFAKNAYLQEEENTFILAEPSHQFVFSSLDEATYPTEMHGAYDIDMLVTN